MLFIIRAAGQNIKYAPFGDRVTGQSVLRRNTKKEAPRMGASFEVCAGKGRQARMPVDCKNRISITMGAT